MTKTDRKNGKKNDFMHTTEDKLIARKPKERGRIIINSSLK